MRGGSVPVLANNTGDAEPAAESQSTQQPVAQQPVGERRLTEQDIVGLKYCDELVPLFKRLHDNGCRRDKTGNRELHITSIV